MLAISLAAGCGSSARPGTAGGITVFAASSLKESFTELGHRFEAAHPGAHVTFNFGASSTLAQQILQGAPVDAFAAADTSTMQKVVDGKAAAAAPVVFAHNVLAIIVATGNPKTIATLADLARSDLVVVLAAPQVPAGAYAQQALAKAGVKVTPKSLEPDVKAVVSKVTTGEADAGIVYATDVTAAKGQADGVTIAAADNVVASYPIVVAKASTNSNLARTFVTFTTGADGRAVLAAYGFDRP